MNAIKSNDENIVPYGCIVRIKKIGDDNYHFYDTLGRLHSCNEYEANKFFKHLN